MKGNWETIAVGAGTLVIVLFLLVSGSGRRVDSSSGGVFEIEDSSDGDVIEVEQTVLVHVAGAVKNPGVYEVSYGARVIDAINAAGSASEDAELDRINLAAKVVDGQRLYVPIAGSDMDSGSINVNDASMQELESIPGIGPALAQRIVDYRHRHGPFTTIEDLENVSGIGPSTIDSIRDFVDVF